MASSAEDLRNLVNSTLKSDALTSGSDPRFKTTYTSTGVLPFDILWHGGIPRGRFIELYGDWSTLKSYVALMSIASFQSKGMIAALIDTEHSFDSDWALSCGVDLEKLILMQPDSGELAMDFAETLIRGKANLIVFDSVAAMSPQAEQSKRLHGENVQPARIAQLMSQALRRLMTANQDCSMLWINQTRTNVGITFGSSEVVTGGKALPYYASFRTAMRKVGKITEPKKTFDGEKWIDTKVLVGQKFKAELIKSKLSRPMAEEYFTWDLRTGALDLVGYCLAQGIEIGLVEQKGNTWSFGSTKAVGREKFREKFIADPDLALELENAVRRHHEIPEVKKVTAKAVRTTKGTGRTLSSSRGKSAPVKKKAGLQRKR